MASEGAETNKDIVFNRTPIIEEGANNVLGDFDTIVIEERAGVRRGRHMLLCTVLDITMLVKR